MSPRSMQASMLRSVRMMVRRLPDAPPVVLALAAVVVIALLMTGIGSLLYRQ